MRDIVMRCFPCSSGECSTSFAGPVGLDAGLFASFYVWEAGGLSLYSLE
jgi:hypothetical protein